MSTPSFPSLGRDRGGDADRPGLVGARVPNSLAEALSTGADATKATARSFTDREITLGLSFLGTILEIASASTKALALVRREREELTGSR